jgi:hypothetical protein
MRIRIKSRYVEIFTETSANQMKVLAILAIWSLAAGEIFVLHNDTTIFAAAATAFCALCGV